MVFGPILGLWDLEKFRARAGNTETQFPAARGTFGREIRLPAKFHPEILHFFTFYVLADCTPTGRKSRNNGFLFYFGLWHLNSGRKKEKLNFPVLGALLVGKSGRPKSFSPKLRNFYFFGRPDPQGREIAKYWGFGPFWPRTALGT